MMEGYCVDTQLLHQGDDQEAQIIHTSDATDGNTKTLYTMGTPKLPSPTQTDQVFRAQQKHWV